MKSPAAQRTEPSQLYANFPPCCLHWRFSRYGQFSVNQEFRLPEPCWISLILGEYARGEGVFYQSGI